MKPHLLIIILTIGLLSCHSSNEKKGIHESHDSISGSQLSKIDPLVNDSGWQSVNDGFGNIINTLYSYHDEILVGGSGLNDGADALITLEGNTEFKIGIKDDAEVSTMINFKGNLIVGGHFDSVGGVGAKNIAEWNGKNWGSFGLGFPNIKPYSTEISALAIYKDELYAAGLFSNSEGAPLSSISKWTGKNWEQLGGGVKGDISALLSTDSGLYVGGAFDSTGNNILVNNIAKWDGNKWIKIADGIGHHKSNVQALVLYKNQIYACGIFEYINNKQVDNIAKWDGEEWVNLGTGLSYKRNKGDACAVSMAVYNGNLYVGGAFEIAGGISVHNIAKWDGDKWSKVGKDDNLEGKIINTLLVSKGALYVGGCSNTLNNQGHHDNMSAFIMKWIGK